MRARTVWAAGAALAGLLLLSACNSSDAQSPARDRSAARGAAAAHSPNRPQTPPPMLNGKPEWADNRQHTAQENLAYQFDRWGSGFGAKDEVDYARKARAFIDRPPKGVETVTRPNGDVILYDRASNTMAIARKDGAPRLFRKPPGGAADWEKARSEASNDTGYPSQRRYRAPVTGDYRSGAD